MDSLSQLAEGRLLGENCLCLTFEKGPFLEGQPDQSRGWKTTPGRAGSLDRPRGSPLALPRVIVFAAIPFRDRFNAAEQKLIEIRGSQLRFVREPWGAAGVYLNASCEVQHCDRCARHGMAPLDALKRALER